MVTGLLITCLIGFAITFMVSNNPLGLNDDSQNIFEGTYNNISPQLKESAQDADVLLNITASTNPTEGYLGGGDSVASSYKAKDSATSYWESSKTMISWIFSGAIGEMLIAVISGLLGFMSFYYIFKFIRNGI
jgi:hypothetical protein